MRDIFLIVITALTTSGLSTIFSYYKEKKFANAKYTEKVLVSLYIPIYKIMAKSPDPISPYEGINFDEVNQIRKVIKENPELTDPKLEHFVFVIEEEIYFDEMGQTQEDYRYGHKLYDNDRKMFDYILKSFHSTRKTLGLPYDKQYGSVLNFMYKKINNSKLKRASRRTWRKYMRRKN